MNKEIKILHIVTFLNFGGLENRLFDYIKNSKNNNFKHYLYCLPSSQELIDKISYLNIEIEWVPQNSRFYDPVLLKPQLILKIKKYINSNNIDIVHTRNLIPNVWGSFAFILSKAKYLITGEYGSVWVTKGFRTILESYAHQYADVVTVNSKATQRMLEVKRNVKREKINIIYDGVINKSSNQELITSYINKFKIKQDHYVIGSIGRFDSPKNYYTLFDTMSYLIQKEPKITLILVGDGNLMIDYKKYIKDKGIGNNVILTS